MLPTCSKDLHLYILLEEILYAQFLQICVLVDLHLKRVSRKRKRLVNTRPYSMLCRIPTQVQHLNRMVRVSDSDCILNLRMDRNTFGKLCKILRELGGLSDGKYVSVEEQVAVFLGILAHHKKNSVVKFDFLRSGQTISNYVHIVLKAILKIHGIFLVKPTPILEDCGDPRWKCFKGCLGAADGTYINIQVPNMDKPRYRNRKGQISTNTLAVCDPYMRFIYVLPGWEGSAADGRVLRDAVNRANGLKVPKGTYYLCDNGYANSEGFLTPYRGVRYHLKEWGPECSKPQNAQEMFNMKHTKARNIIERAFGVMKMRWGILRSASFYPVKVHNRLIMACFMLHNFIRSEMALDPCEEMIDELDAESANEEHGDGEEYIDYVESSFAWNSFRDELAQSMWQA